MGIFFTWVNFKLIMTSPGGNKCDFYNFSCYYSQVTECISDFFFKAEVANFLPTVSGFQLLSAIVISPPPSPQIYSHYSYNTVIEIPNQELKDKR